MGGTSAVHGDGGTFKKQESVFVLSWNSCWVLARSISPSLLSHFRSLRMQPSTRIGPMLADFNLLPRGADADAKPRADCWSAVLVNIRGDWECVADVFWYPRCNMNGGMCFKCGATGIGTENGANPCVLFREMTWEHQSVVMADGLHAVDPGTRAHIVGNIFTEKLHNTGLKNVETGSACLEPRARECRQCNGTRPSRVCERPLRCVSSFAVELARCDLAGSRHDKQVCVIAESLQKTSIPVSPGWF